MEDKFSLANQLRNFVAHLNTYRKKRHEFLSSADDVRQAANHYQVSETELRTLLKSK